MLRPATVFVLLAAVLTGCGGAATSDVQQRLVTTLSDNGSGSLRDVLSTATPGAIIRFDSSLSGTIFLTAPIVLDGAVTIEGAEDSEIIVRPDVGLAAFEVRPGADLTLRTLKFHGPAAAVMVDQGRVILDRVDIEAVELGSPIESRGGIVEMFDCEVRDCDAPVPGGAIRVAGGITRIRRCTFANNTAAESGGAVHQDGGVLEMVNCTLHANRAISGSTSHGGAVRSLDSAASIANAIFLHCTITSNQADVGGGLSLSYPLAGLGVVRGCIVAQNIGSPADIAALIPLTVEGGFNLIGDGDGGPFVTLTNGNFVGTTVNPWDPFLSALIDLGGHTRTRQPLSISRAFAMITQANCLDIDGTPLEVDQRGFPRPQGNCEAGAYER